MDYEKKYLKYKKKYFDLQNTLTNSCVNDNVEDIIFTKNKKKYFDLQNTLINPNKKKYSDLQNTIINSNKKKYLDLHGGYELCSSNPYFIKMFCLFNIFNQPFYDWDRDKSLINKDITKCNVSRTNIIISNLFGLMCNLQCSLPNFVIFKKCSDVIIIDWANIMNRIHHNVYDIIEEEHKHIVNDHNRYRSIYIGIKQKIITMFNNFIKKYISTKHIIFIIHKPVRIGIEMNQRNYVNVYNIIDFFQHNKQFIKEHLELDLFVLNVEYFPENTEIIEKQPKIKQQQDIIQQPDIKRQPDIIQQPDIKRQPEIKRQPDIQPDIQSEDKQPEMIQPTSSLDDVLFWLITISVFNLLYINGKKPILLTNDTQKIFDNNKTILDNIHIIGLQYSITHLAISNMENFEMIYNQCDNICLRRLIDKIILDSSSLCKAINIELLYSNTQIFSHNNLLNSLILDNIIFINNKKKTETTMKKYIENNIIKKNNFLINFSGNNICSSILYITYITIIQKIVFKENWSLSDKEIMAYFEYPKIIDTMDYDFFNPLVGEYVDYRDNQKIINKFVNINDPNMIDCNTKLSILSNVPNQLNNNGLELLNYNVLSFDAQKRLLTFVESFKYDGVNIIKNKFMKMSKDIILEKNTATIVKYLEKKIDFSQPLPIPSSAPDIVPSSSFVPDIVPNSTPMLKPSNVKGKEN